MRLLIIEDNITLCDFMREGMEKAGFSVDTANMGSEGEQKAFANQYDAILLDLNLPDKDGIDILKFLCNEQVESPIIIITARDAVNQKALGLDMGADDYLTKPFELIELRARVQAVIRRFHGRTNPVIQIERLSINPATRKTEYDGKEVPLAAKEFDILEYLASRYPAVVSAEELIEHIYDEEFDPFSAVLRVHMTRLRKKLNAVSEKEIIETIRGKGYSICVK